MHALGSMPAICESDIDDGWYVPTKIRAMLCVGVALATGLAFYFESGPNGDVSKWIALGLGAAMIGAVWLFPETSERGRRSG